MQAPHVFFDAQLREYHLLAHPDAQRHLGNVTAERILSRDLLVGPESFQINWRQAVVSVCVADKFSCQAYVRGWGSVQGVSPQCDEPFASGGGSVPA